MTVMQLPTPDRVWFRKNPDRNFRIRRGSPEKTAAFEHVHNFVREHIPQSSIDAVAFPLANADEDAKHRAIAESAQPACALFLSGATHRSPPANRASGQMRGGRLNPLP